MADAMLMKLLLILFHPLFRPRIIDLLDYALKRLFA